MVHIRRVCLQCAYPAESNSPRCAECGSAVPLDLRVLAGATLRGNLSRGDLFIRSLLRAAFGVFALVFASAGIAWLIYLTLQPNRGGGRGSGGGLVFAFVVFGLVGIAGIWLLARLPARIRAIMSETTAAQDLRWAWTDREFWRDARSFPNDGEPWDDFHRVTLVRKGDALCVHLGEVRPRGITPTQIWIHDPEDDGEAIRAELARHVETSRAP